MSLSSSSPTVPRRPIIDSCINNVDEVEASRTGARHSRSVHLQQGSTGSETAKSRRALHSDPCLPPAPERSHPDKTDEDHAKSTAANHIQRGVPVVDFVRAVWKYTPDMIPARSTPYTLSRLACRDYCQCHSERAFRVAFHDILVSLLQQLYPTPPEANAGASSPASTAGSVSTATSSSVASSTTAISASVTSSSTAVTTCASDNNNKKDIVEDNKPDYKDKQEDNEEEDDDEEGDDDGNDYDGDDDDAGSDSHAGSVRQPPSRPLDASFLNMTDNLVYSDLGSDRPNFAWCTFPNSMRRGWPFILVSGEVKRPHQLVFTHEDDVEVDLRRFHPDLKSGLPLRTVAVECTPVDGSSDTSTCSRKRPRDASDDEVGRPSKRAAHGTLETEPATCLVDDAPLSDDEVVAVTYLFQMMSSGARSNASAFSVDGLDISLWYADRMGLVKSQSFNFLEEPHYLALVVAALGTADLRALGYFSLLSSLHTVFDDYADTRFFLPSGTLLHEGSKTDRPLVYDFDVERRIVQDYDMLGRGTTILPLSSKAMPHERLQAFVVKLSWQEVSRPSEHANIMWVRRCLAKRKPDYLKHIVEVKCGLRRSMKGMDLPRVYLSDLPEPPKLRVRECRVLVMKAYQPLERVDSVEEFKHVVLDVIRAHHWVWKTSSLLHCDISIDNIMFYGGGDKIVGVLCDWDLALQKAPGESDDEKIDDIYLNTTLLTSSDKTKSASEMQAQAQDVPARVERRERVGTLPFMALDLTSSLIPPHQYRYDLESFFFMIAFFCAYFDPGAHRIRPDFDDWYDLDMETADRKKRKFLLNAGQHDKIFRSADPQYRALADDWVPKLRGYFEGVNHSQWSELLELRAQYAEAKMAKKEKETGELRNEVARTVQMRNNAITYAGFMECLGASVG